MQFKFKPGHDFTIDHRSFNDLSADPILPEKIHVFRRNEPNHGNFQINSNIDTQFILWVCLKGCGCLLIDNITYILKENDVIITFPGQPHLRLPLNDEKVDWLLIRFVTTPPDWFNMFRCKILRMSAKSIRFLQEFGNAYLEAVQTPMPNIAIECCCWLGLLLNSLRQSQTLDEQVFRLATQGTDYVRQACQLIMSPQFVGKPFKAIAQHLQVSPSHLRAVFKQTTGTTPGSFIIKNRIFSIQHLLLHSTLNITHIAEKSGFDSIYTLSRFFRKQCGVSPRQYRNQHKV